MGKNYLSGLDFFSNQAGVAIFYLSTITNDYDVTNDLRALTKNNLFVGISDTEQSHIETKNFEPLASSNVNLIHNKDSYDEEQAILDFANKLLGSSRDIEPEINSIVQAHFWELL